MGSNVPFLIYLTSMGSRCRHRCSLPADAHQTKSLVSIEQQAQKVCQNWNIPYLSLDETRAEDIATVLEAMEEKPRVITATISRVSAEEVQRALRKLPILTICIDEAQVLPGIKGKCHFCPRSSTQMKSWVGLAFCLISTHQQLQGIQWL